MRLLFESPDGVYRFLVELGTRLLVGRCSPCDVIIASPTVSRQQLWIDYGHEGCFVEDAGSTGGTYVNQQRMLESQRLVPGDAISLGETELRYREVEAETLSERVMRGEPIESNDLVSLFDALADDLARIHDAGMIHQTLTLHEIAFVPEPRLLFVGVPDNSLFGHPRHISPEMCTGESITSASDLYMLGSVLYEGLTGRPVYQYETIPELLQQKLTAPVVVPDEYPAPARALLSRLLERDPERRR